MLFASCGPRVRSASLVVVTIKHANLWRGRPSVGGTGFPASISTSQNMNTGSQSLPGAPLPPPLLPNLFAMAAALAVAGVAVTGGYQWSRAKQEKLLHSAAPEFCDAKLHGVALIREALSRPDTLVLFGSSELIPDVPMKGVDFFADAPTGFSVFPVGKAGTTALSVLQKLGGSGEELAGKKVVLSLSPGFFQTEAVDAKYFEGNSSKLQLKEFLWNEQYSDRLKKDVAVEMLKFPKIVDGDWILRFTLEHVASGNSWDRVMLRLIQPYAVLDRAVGRLQDNFEAAFALNADPEVSSPSHFRPKRGHVLNWDDLFRTAEQQSSSLAQRAKQRPLKVTRAKGTWDNQFVAKMRKAQEWNDFELVLRLLKEAGAKPLVISMPLHADILEAQGVSEVARMEYGTRLQALTKQYNAPLVYLKDHESDPVFFVDQHDHIGSKGWWYYNRLIDDFYHDRLSTSAVAQQSRKLP